jgi:hypothetical protein
MVHFPNIALWRGWPRFVSQAPKTVKLRLPLKLSKHLARDIGLSKVELDQLNFEWPSDSDKRPLI